MLGFESVGWKKDGDKLAGVPTKLIVVDDQRKPDVGLRVTRKLLRSDKVHIVSGVIWSNVLMTVQRPVTRAKRVLISTNAGPAPLAGRKCSPYFVSTSWQNDGNHEAAGQLITDDKIKKLYILSANYQAGKDAAAGVKRFYKGGKIVGQTLYKLGQTDFQAEISKVKAAKPEAVWIFAPGGMGIAFMKQWAASGAGKDIKLYSSFTVDNATLPAIGAAAIGTYHPNYWSADLKNAANEKFVKDYTAKYGKTPSHFAAQSYDMPRLIAAALKKMGGFDENNLRALAKAMRTTDYDSVRGPYSYNVNGFPIENFYKRVVVKGDNGKPMIKLAGTVFKDHKDVYYSKCPKSRQ
jgi:branched-chain amino acid transport system substrate-binding protein